MITEGQVCTWLNYARMKMKEIADGGDGKKIATTWLRDFEIDVSVARGNDTRKIEIERRNEDGR